MGFDITKADAVVAAHSALLRRNTQYYDSRLGEWEVKAKSVATKFVYVITKDN